MRECTNWPRCWSPTLRLLQRRFTIRGTQASADQHWSRFWENTLQKMVCQNISPKEKFGAKCFQKIDISPNRYTKISVAKHIQNAPDFWNPAINLPIWQLWYRDVGVNASAVPMWRNKLILFWNLYCRHRLSPLRNFIVQ